jgi:hypothetical protein
MGHIRNSFRLFGRRPIHIIKSIKKHTAFKRTHSIQKEHHEFKKYTIIRGLKQHSKEHP